MSWHSNMAGYTMRLRESCSFWTKCPSNKLKVCPPEAQSWMPCHLRYLQFYYCKKEQIKLNTVASSATTILLAARTAASDRTAVSPPTLATPMAVLAVDISIPIWE